MKNTQLPPYLAHAQQHIEDHAREYGLDFFPIIYEVLDYRTLYETASLGGFPTRYPHWRFGMEYDQLIKGHVWMGSTIYEMIINTNPAYGYLLEGNEDVTQKMVMAHVCAHVDFFKNNMWFAHTNRKMLDEMANHAARIWRIIDRYGFDVVEDFIDTCLSLENLIDYHAPYIRRPEMQIEQPIAGDYDEEVEVEGLKVDREYMREYINPPEFLAEQRKRLEDERQQQRQFPANPQKDILLFLLNYAPLERWQHTILNIIREEAYYFAPQGMTKILNEGWACLCAGSLVFTDRGLLPIEELVQRQQSVSVADGQTTQRVYDWATFTNRQIVRIQTQRGFVVAGSITHQLLLEDGKTWRRLDELQVGDQVMLRGGGNLWPQAYVTLEQPLPRAVAPQPVEQTSERLLTPAQGSYAQESTLAGRGALVATEPAIASTVLDAELAAFLGHLAGTEQVNTIDNIDAAILRSPASVVAAFLRALYDSRGEIAETGITFSATSEEVSNTIQLLLLNFGILTTRSCQSDSWSLQVTGHSAMLFAEMIGFGDPHKQTSLQTYLTAHQHYQHEAWHDTIVAIEYGQADVYDMSVELTHRYAAQGFINHNSFWHSEIMTKRALEDSELISFADLHSGVVATSSGRLNPYKLGIELLRDVEERWDKGQFGKEYDECDDIATKRNWDLQLGLGRQKIFEIRRLYNDVTFIDEFLTPEFALRQKLFSFRYNRDTDYYEIASREFKQVKEKLLFQLTNFGQPFIYVEDANHNNRGELYLKHRHEGVDLQANYARETMRNLHKIWTRPVHVETVMDERRRLLTFDGTDFHERRID